MSRRSQAPDARGSVLNVDTMIASSAGSASSTSRAPRPARTVRMAVDPTTEPVTTTPRFSSRRPVAWLRLSAGATRASRSATASGVAPTVSPTMSSPDLLIPLRSTAMRCSSASVTSNRVTIGLSAPICMLVGVRQRTG
ncbi:hypothetical protein ASF06_18915 [Agreia sp. Leaf244]|nr:hypothetical protein ASF06_18915 [Agreia sp. Leaf244]